MRAVLAVLVIGLAVLFALPALAQQVDIQIPAPERAPEPAVIPPGDHYEATRPSDTDYYPEGPKVRHDPTFIGPLSRKIDTPAGPGRIGVAAWTAPNTPVGTRQLHSQLPGWFAVGFAIEWGGPPPPPVKRPAR
ncbi:MAG: hypothetical protein HY728_06025 [Candidatus Rokubacteria bacterium]|nr:hypothetical protein [Candidatus Rokubacteria bacterium]